MKRLTLVAGLLFLSCAFPATGMSEEREQSPTVQSVGSPVFSAVRGRFDEADPYPNEPGVTFGAEAGYNDENQNYAVSAGYVHAVDERIAVFANLGIDAFSLTNEEEGGSNGDTDFSFVNVGVNAKITSGFFGEVAVSYDDDMLHTRDEYGSWGLHMKAGHQAIYLRASHRMSSSSPTKDIDSLSSTTIGLTATHRFELGDATGLRVSGHLDKALETKAETEFGVFNDSGDGVVKRVSVSMDHNFNESFRIAGGVWSTFLPDDLGDEVLLKVGVSYRFGT